VNFLTVNVVYSSSDYYAQCTGVSMLSLLENNREVANIQIFIVDSDISSENRQKLTSIADKYKREISFLQVRDYFPENLDELGITLSRGSYNTYARVFMNRLFGSLDKALLIDSDTLVINSIRELWETDLTDMLIAAVPEVAVYAKGSTYEDHSIVESSINYYNMGIALFNLKEWRHQNVDELITTRIKNYGKNFFIADQSILNFTINDKIKRIHLKNNFYTAVHGISYRTLQRVFSEKTVFTRQEFLEAKDKPVVLHFVGHPFERPWYSKSASPYKRLYLEYRSESPWANLTPMMNPKAKNPIFGVYDNAAYLLSRLRLYDLNHWFRYRLGQRMKELLHQNRNS